jgi:hypothetical protein
MGAWGVERGLCKLNSALGLIGRRRETCVSDSDLRTAYSGPEDRIGLWDAPSRLGAISPLRRVRIGQ